MRIRALKILSIVFAVMGALSLLLAAFFRLRQFRPRGAREEALRY